MAERYDLNAADQYADTAWAAWAAQFGGELTAREAFDAGHSIGWKAGYKVGVHDGRQDA